MSDAILMVDFDGGPKGLPPVSPSKLVEGLRALLGTVYQARVYPDVPDAGIEMLREANAAFGNYTASEPGVPELNQQGKDTLKFSAGFLASLARTLKEEARRAKELGDEMGALLIIRLQLSVEETGEWAEALALGDLKKAARELTDMQYVTDGHYLTLGLGDLKLPLYRAVHGDNMRKLGPDGKPIISEAGRWVKPEGWEATDLSSILEPEQ